MWSEFEGKVGEGMRSIPFGYRIENGEAKIDENNASQVKALFDAYISGLTLKEAAERAGIPGYHTSIGRILKNQRYLGDDYYPALIDEETFHTAQKLRQEKAEKLGRIHDYEKSSEPAKPKKMTFTLGKVTEKYTDPYEQAEYVYSLIETEVEDEE